MSVNVPRMEFFQPLFNCPPPLLLLFHRSFSNHISHIFKNKSTNLERGKLTTAALKNKYYLTREEAAPRRAAALPFIPSKRRQHAAQIQQTHVGLEKKNALTIHQNVSAAGWRNYRGLCVCLCPF